MKKRRAVIVNNTRRERHAGCTAVMDGLEAMLASAGYDVTFQHPVGKDWNNPKFLRYARKAHLIVVNGEGSIRHSNERARTLSAVAVFASEHKIKSALVNCTLYENDAEVMGNIKKFDLVACRDSYSVDVCRTSGINAVQTPDFSFMTALPQAEHGNEAGTQVFTDSVLKQDRELLEQASAFQGGLYVPIKGIPSPQAYVDAVKVGAGVIAGRFHAACLCLNAGVPFLGLESNTPKTSFLLHDIFGHTRRMVTVEDVRGGTIVQSFDDNELAAIADYKDRGREQFGALQKKLAKMVAIRRRVKKGPPPKRVFGPLAWLNRYWKPYRLLKGPSFRLAVLFKRAVKAAQASYGRIR